MEGNLVGTSVLVAQKLFADYGIGLVLLISSRTSFSLAIPSFCTTVVDVLEVQGAGVYIRS